MARRKRTLDVFVASNAGGRHVKFQRTDRERLTGRDLVEIAEAITNSKNGDEYLDYEVYLGSVGSIDLKAKRTGWSLVRLT